MSLRFNKKSKLYKNKSSNYIITFLKALFIIAIIAILVIVIIKGIEKYKQKVKEDEFKKAFDEAYNKELENTANRKELIKEKWKKSGCKLEDYPPYLDALTDEEIDNEIKKISESISDANQMFCNGKIRFKFLEGSNKWKYVYIDNDLDCLTDWDHLDSKGELIKKNIARDTIETDGFRRWCPTNRDTTLAERTYDEPKTTLQKIGGIMEPEQWAVEGTMLITELFFDRILRTVKSINKAKTSLSILKKGTYKLNLLKNYIKNLSKIIGKNISYQNVKSAVKSGNKIGKLTASVVKNLKLIKPSSLKVLAKLKPGPMLLFDIFSGILDIADVGGYNTMQTKAMMYELKKSSEDEYKKSIVDIYKTEFSNLDISKETTFEEFIKEIDYPAIYNPLSEFDEDEINNFIAIGLQQRFESKTPTEPSIIAYNKKIQEDIDAGILSFNDIGNSEKMEKYYSILDMDEINQSIINEICINNDGTVIKGGKDTSGVKEDDICTYSYDKCVNSYNWPLKDDDTYKEFINGKCYIANPQMRKMCDEQFNLEYDEEKGICKIDENYCKSKGADYKFNKELNDYDCNVSTTQNAIESVLGTTITRGLKQIFDYKQYEKCDKFSLLRINNKCIDRSDPNKLIFKPCDKNNKKQRFFVSIRDQAIKSSEYPYDQCITLNSDNKTFKMDKCAPKNIFNVYDKDSAMKNWKYTRNPKDDYCLETWDAYDTSNKNLKEIRVLTSDADLGIDTSGSDDSKKLWCPSKEKYDRTSKQLFKLEQNIGRITYMDNKDLVFTNNNDILELATHIPNKINIEYDGDGYLTTPKDINSPDIVASQTILFPKPDSVIDDLVNEASLACQISGYYSRPADCPTGYTNNGATCGRGAQFKTSDFGLGPYESADCPPSYTNTGTTCFRSVRSFERDYFSKAFSTISSDVKRCEEKYGKDNCEIKGVTGSRLARPKTCEIEARYLKKEFPDKYVDDNLTTMGARCYIHADTIGTISKYGICPPSNDKNKKYTKKIGALCYVDCEKEYGSGWYNNGTKCAKDVSTLGMDSMTCKYGEFKRSARCGKECPPGYTNTGEECGKTKKRVVDFSTKQI